jgi:putative membrane protein
MISFGIAITYADFDGHMDWGGGWEVAMAIGALLFWALVIAALVWLVRELSASRHVEPSQESTPLAILDRRLADGSISVDEYRERRAELVGTDGGASPA